MPATSSAPGSQPEAVAKKNQKTAVKQAAQAIKPVVKQTAKAVASSTQITEAASSVAHSVASGASAPPKGSSRPRSGHAHPEPALQPYKPPKPVAVKVKSDLRSLDAPKAQKAAKQPIVIGPHLQGNQIRVTPHKTVVSTDIAHRAISSLPKPQRQQAAQKLKAQKPPAPKPAKPPKPVRQHVKQRLKTAAKKQATSSLDRAFAPGETIAPHQAALLAEAEGLPGKTYQQIAHGESGYQPAAESPDGGHGLWQMTPRVQSAQTVAAWDKIASEHPGGYHNPVAAAEMAKYLAGSSTGTSNYFGTAYMTNPDAHTKGGQAKAIQQLQGKPIPPALKQKAKQVLGAQTTQKVIAHAQAPTASSTQPKELPGPLSGSREVVRQLVGSKVRGDHGVHNEGTIHTPGGDHYDPHSYAQDINSGPTAKAEHEPPYNQATLDKIVKNARKFGFQDVPALKIGQNYEGTAKGYRLQLLTDEGGTINHIHVGVRWEGAGATSTTSYGTSAPTTTGTVSTATSGTASAPSSSRKGRSSRRRRRKNHKRPSVRLSPLPAALNPADYQALPATPTSTPKITVSV